MNLVLTNNLARSSLEGEETILRVGPLKSSQFFDIGIFILSLLLRASSLYCPGSEISDIIFLVEILPRRLVLLNFLS